MLPAAAAAAQPACSSSPVLRPAYRTRCSTVRLPNCRPVRSSAMEPFRADFFGTHPQLVIVPLLSRFVSARISPPQSQRHFHTLYRSFFSSVRPVTVSMPNRLPVRSFSFATFSPLTKETAGQVCSRLAVSFLKHVYSVFSLPQPVQARYRKLPAD